MDRALGIIFLAGCVPTFIVAYQGYERFIRATQQNIEAGVRDYNEISRDHLVFASVNAYSMLTKQPLTGTVELVGALNPHTLVFRGADRRLHTMGREFQADYVVRSILCQSGAPARSTIRNIDVSNRLLSEISSSLDASSENYLFGDLSTSDRVSLPENIRMFTTISGSGGLIKFNYATCDDILASNLDNVLVTKGVITVKTIVSPGRAVADSAQPNSPGSGGTIRITSLLEPKDSVQILKSKGDSIRENEVLGRKDVARFFGEQKALLEGKIDALGEHAVAAASETEEKIAGARQAIRIDSGEVVHTAELLRNGFISEDVFKMSQLKWLRNKRTLSELIVSKAAATAKTTIEMGTLELAMKEIEAKSVSSERQSEIRSPVDGILLEVRRLPHNEKTELVFIIKRLR